VLHVCSFVVIFFSLGIFVSPLFFFQGTADVSTIDVSTTDDTGDLLPNNNGALLPMVRNDDERRRTNDGGRMTAAAHRWGCSTKPPPPPPPPPPPGGGKEREGTNGGPLASTRSSSTVERRRRWRRRRVIRCEGREDVEKKTAMKTTTNKCTCGTRRGGGTVSQHPSSSTVDGRQVDDDVPRFGSHQKESYDACRRAATTVRGKERMNERGGWGG